MSAHLLYNQIKEQLQFSLQEPIRPSSLDRLALLVLGILEARSASPMRIARALHTLGLTTATAESIERRIRRLENDPLLTDAICLHPFIEWRLRFSNPQRLLLLLDPTTQCEHVVMVTVAIWYRGRALPIAWAVWPTNRPLEGKGFWQRIEALLDTVLPLIPKACEVIWLADRAFGTPKFTDMILARGWSFVVRLQGQTRCLDRNGRQKRVDALIHPKRLRGKMRGLVFKKEKWRKLSLACLWGKNHNSPLCVASDLPLGWYLLRLYRRRYPIEALFRDYKSFGWQWELGQVRDLDHLHRLLVGMALASWFTLLAGAELADDILAKKPSGKRRTRPWCGKLSLFQLGLDALRKAILSNVPPPFNWWHLGQLTELNWSEQIYFHHARAFVYPSTVSG